MVPPNPSVVGNTEIPSKLSNFILSIIVVSPITVDRLHYPSKLRRLSLINISK
jgi:hypothetical protein